MQRWALFWGILALASCSKKNTDVQAPPAENTAPVETAVAEPAKEAKPVQVTDALLLKYVQLQKEQVAILRGKLEELQKEAAKFKDNTGWRQGAAYIAKVSEMTKQIEDDKVQLRKKIGLTEEEAAQLQSVVGEVSTMRLMWKKGGGDKTIEEMEKQFKAQLSKVPPAERAQAEAEMGKITQSLKDSRDLKDARQKYGDATVDLLLKHDEELSKLLEEQLTLGTQLR